MPSLTPEPNVLVYIGTYTGPQSQGIYAFRFQTDTGELVRLGLAAEIANPSFLAIHPNRRLLYAVQESGEAGALSALAIEDLSTGSLTLLNTVTSHGADPCHIAVDATGHCVLAANYSSGSVVACPILPDGALGEATTFIPHEGHSVHPVRQKSSHAHAVDLSPDSQFVIVADLGTDQLISYRIEANEESAVLYRVASVSVKPGAGPRHTAFHPNGQFAYAIGEMDGTVIAFHYNASEGSLTEIQTVPLSPDADPPPPSAAEIVVDAKGKFLYGSDRGDNSISAFSIHENNGTLSFLQKISTKGKTPRNFALDPTGMFLLAANQDSHNVVVFRVNPETGLLSDTGHEVQCGSPACILFL